MATNVGGTHSNWYGLPHTCAEARGGQQEASSSEIYREAPRRWSQWLGFGVPCGVAPTNECRAQRQRTRSGVSFPPTALSDASSTASLASLVRTGGDVASVRVLLLFISVAVMNVVWWRCCYSSSVITNPVVFSRFSRKPNGSSLGRDN